MDTILKINSTISLKQKYVDVICLLIMGFEVKEIAAIIGYSTPTVQGYCCDLYLLFNVPHSNRLKYAAQLEGFDIHGRFKGQPVLQQFTRNLLTRNYTWVVLKPAGVI